MVLLGAGCASTTLVNTSPVSPAAVSPDFKTIPATVRVVSDDKTNVDVANALSAASVFSQTQTDSSDARAGDLTLTVSSTSKSNGHFAPELAYAVLRGLLLGAADGAFADKYDYSVTLTATLQKGSTVVSEYEAAGSYHSECPESSA